MQLRSRVPGGRLTSELFADMGVGDEVVVRGPNGDMVLDAPTERSGVGWTVAVRGVRPRNLLHAPGER